MPKLMTTYAKHGVPPEAKVHMPCIRSKFSSRKR